MYLTIIFDLTLYRMLLQVINLAENQLTDINGLFTSLPALVSLNVSFNSLKWFDMAFFPKQLERCSHWGYLISSKLSIFLRPEM